MCIRFVFNALFVYFIIVVMQQRFMGTYNYYIFIHKCKLLYVYLFYILKIYDVLGLSLVSVKLDCGLVMWVMLLELETLSVVTVPEGNGDDFSYYWGEVKA